MTALPIASQPLTQSGPAVPIPAWIRFCGHWPAECAVDLSNPATIALTPWDWEVLVGINRRVNAGVAPEPDQDHWGIEDRWDFAEDGSGDCEDYQLLKPRLLVEAGFPRRALCMTVVINEEGVGHAVLMVRTDRGELILDNKRNAILPWDRTGYTCVKREGDDGMAWASLGSRTFPTMVADR
jgi:predicted transglutaminase-like cysteine proteinase